jgi:hypothetical protein
MAGFLDGLLMAGSTWEKLEARCKAESAKRGVSTLATLGQIKAHVRYRASQTKKWKVETNDSGARMTVVTQPAKAQPKAKAKPPAKNGQRTGRKTRAVKTNGRQAVEQAPEPTPAQTVEEAA